MPFLFSVKLRLGADRFYQLVMDNYYNCATFFRVVPNFVVQFGIASQPDETTKWNVDIPDDPVKQSNLEGYLTFATAGANTRTTQIFINKQPKSSTPKQLIARWSTINDKLVCQWVEV